MEPVALSAVGSTNTRSDIKPTSSVGSSLLPYCSLRGTSAAGLKLDHVGRTAAALRASRVGPFLCKLMLHQVNYLGLIGGLTIKATTVNVISALLMNDLAQQFNF